VAAVTTAGDRGPRVERAWAKLTVTLRITGVRPDGYHLIDAEMVSLDLADDLVFGAGDDLVVISAAGGGLPVAADGDNLVRRALAAVDRRAAVRLTKRIPAGAGLGGGSADAAAVLRWAGRASGGEADLALAVRLGADVPFCLSGGRARVTGIGERLERLACRPGDPVTLLTPPFGLSTTAVYREWDAMGAPTADGPNDLEPAAVRVEPRLTAWRDRLGEATGRTPVLAGSGSTWWVPGSYADVPGAVVARTVCPTGVGPPALNG